MLCINLSVSGVARNVFFPFLADLAQIFRSGDVHSTTRVNVNTILILIIT